jgi:hypothetical protein
MTKLRNWDLSPGENGILDFFYIQTPFNLLVLPIIYEREHSPFVGDTISRDRVFVEGGIREQSRIFDKVN